MLAILFAAETAGHVKFRQRHAQGLSDGAKGTWENSPFCTPIPPVGQRRAPVPTHPAVSVGAGDDELCLHVVEEKTSPETV